MYLLFGSYFYRSTTELNIPITIKYRKSKGENRNGGTVRDRMSACNAAPEIFQSIFNNQDLAFFGKFYYMERYGSNDVELCMSLHFYNRNKCIFMNVRTIVYHSSVKNR